MLPRAHLKRSSCWHLPAVLRTLGPTCRDPKSPEVSTGHWSTGRGRAGTGHGSGEQPMDLATILSPKAGGVRKPRLPEGRLCPRARSQRATAWVPASVLDTLSWPVLSVPAAPRGHSETVPSLWKGIYYQELKTVWGTMPRKQREMRQSHPSKDAGDAGDEKAGGLVGWTTGPLVAVGSL